MSRVIIEDTGNLWQISGSGDVKWMGTVNGVVDLELVGKIDPYTINGTPTVIPATTGMHYKTGVATSFNAYDGFETSEQLFYFSAYTIILLYAINVMLRFVSWKNTP